MPLVYIGYNSITFLIYSAVTYITFVTGINQDGVSSQTPFEADITSLPHSSSSSGLTTQKYFINLKPIILSSRVKQTDRDYPHNSDPNGRGTAMITSPPSVQSSQKDLLRSFSVTNNKPSTYTTYSPTTSSNTRYKSSTQLPRTTKKYKLNNNPSLYSVPVASYIKKEANNERTTSGKIHSPDVPYLQPTRTYKFNLKPPQIINRLAKTISNSVSNSYGTTTVSPLLATIRHANSKFTLSPENRISTTSVPTKIRKYIFDAHPPTFFNRWGKSTLSPISFSTDKNRLATDTGTRSFPNEQTTQETRRTESNFVDISSTGTESRPTTLNTNSPAPTNRPSEPTSPTQKVATTLNTRWHHPRRTTLNTSSPAPTNQPLVITSPVQRVATTLTTQATTRWHHPIMWDNWSFWGPCSRSCGQGVKIRTRICLIWTGEIFSRTHLTACEGTNIDYKLCSRRRCPGQKATFREEQCHAIGKNSYRGRRHITWKPVFDKNRPCDLNCQADVRSRHYNFGSVQDGTRCHPAVNSVCIDGQCKVVGCDGIIQSPVQTDRCGVCGGRNDTCTLVHGTLLSRSPTFQEEFPGYYELITIPRGSRHFKVLDNSRNNIALMDDQRQFVINGNRNLSYTGTYTVAGTSVKYIRSGVFAELIEGAGPLTEDVHIMLLYRQKNHEIKYEFWKPNIPTKADDDESTQLLTTSRTSMAALDHTTARTQTLSEDQIWKMLIEGLIGPEKERRPDVYSPTKSTVYNKVASNKRKNEAAIDFPTSSDLNFGRRKKHKKNKFDKKNCKKCPKVKDRKKQFCESDFVTRIRVRGADIINRETRYEVIVLKNYKNGFSMMSREYLWVPNVCKCPKLKIGVDFLVMGRLSTVQHREIRLEVTPEDYVRKFKPRLEPKLQRMKRKLKCK